MNDDLSVPSNYRGPARLFPLPNLVLFPGVLQGLHIFEPRYRQMTADALAEDRLIALVLLSPGWELHYAGRPAIYDTACLGRIETDQRLEDGRYNLQLRGLERIHIRQEIETSKLYRSARVQVLEEVPVTEAHVESELRRRLARVVPAWCAGQEPATTVFGRLLKSSQALGRVCDILSYAFPLSMDAKQELLESVGVEHRARRLLGYLESHPPPLAGPPPRPSFPPEFSSN
jgi:Lon protease-like protein